ncbi:integrase [Patescibacteria group bacterium]|nr:integrase [Patescibacteria group bacterium]MCG2702146.1 integrase [Candidatus Parcubacteria bacterium]MBU4264795.1 integrase [Patescibacteria group bacterium]MBU4390133.1 integrase [Patescibacteria group bacterium]MBU4397345.1 integrase [Patescibacteria group bacterium]
MNDSRLNNINQLKAFLKGTQKLDLSLRKASLEKRYKFIDQTIDRFQYKYLRKKDKRIILCYLKKLTGYRKAQIHRLVKRSCQGKLTKSKYKRTNPNREYSSFDIKLLEKTDELHCRLSEKATKEILRREVELFGKEKYQKIAQVSHAHVSNLRHHSVYRNAWVNHTKARQIQIGITMPPENHGKPGSIKVDAVHQRDIYHINSVDEITQWEIVICVPRITDAYMEPALKEMIDQYPFTIFNFHSDRGGENINYKVARLLHKLLIKQTKSRASHPNDNALVESKNGSVIRKNMGWEYIHKSVCDNINYYYRHWFNPYLNFHRPCGFPTIIVEEKGKRKRIYNNYKVPYEALKSLPKADRYLKKGISFDILDTIAYKMSDNDFAFILREEERKLFNIINKFNQKHSWHRKTKS